MDTTKAGQAQRAVWGSGALEWFTRIGFAAKGVVYLLVGALALMAALRQGGETTSKEGVLHRVASQPFGEVALAVIGFGLIGYSLWRLLCAIADIEHEGSDAAGFGKRMFYLASAAVYGSAALYAFKMLTSGSGGGGGKEDAVSARILEVPGGVLLLTALGVAILIGAAMQIRDGWKARFREHLQLSEIDAPHRDWIVRAGQWGYIARGVVFAVIGFFITVAALRHNPERARGIEGALDALAARPFGQFVLGFTAIGLACYGVFSLIESRYRRLKF